MPIKLKDGTEVQDNLTDANSHLARLVTQARSYNDECQEKGYDSERTAKIEAYKDDIVAVRDHIKGLETGQDFANFLGEDFVGNDGADSHGQPMSQLDKDFPKLESVDFRMKPFDPVSNSADYFQADPDATCSQEYRQAFREYITSVGHHPKFESMSSQVQNKLQYGGDAGEEYLVAPQNFYSQFLRECDSVTFFRRLATVVPATNLAPTGFRVRTKKFSGHSWSCRCTKPTDDSPNVGLRVLTPNPSSFSTSVCRDLLRRIRNFNVEAFLAQEMAINVAEAEETAFLTGDGKQKPLGIFTDSSDGLDSTVDTETTNVGAVISDDLIRTYMDVCTAARNSAGLAWILPTVMVRQVMLLKDSDGQYMWRPGLQQGVPDVLIGRRVFETDVFAPTITGGEYVACLGDYSKYFIAQGPNLRLEREVKPAEDEMIWYGRRYIDGGPILRTYFRRLKVKSA